MIQPLWKPTPEMIEKSQMTQFLTYVNNQYNLSLKNYPELHHWSVHNIAKFWKSSWNFFEIISSKPYSNTVEDIQKMPGAKWFSEAQLNFAENLLRYRDDRTALIFQDENGNTRSITFRELYKKVSQTAFALKQLDVKKGDRVAAFLPNIPETVIAMLATASIGAVWSSSSPDFGIKGVLDRFSQIKPKVLFSSYGYYYNGKCFSSIDKLNNIINHLPETQNVIMVPYGETEDISSMDICILWEDFIDPTHVPTLNFEQLPFDHPLYIMYSSGTTGLPKSIVHSAGGTLIQHLKELRLHTDLTRDDVIFYFTTCGWMMWNWLISSLAVGATIVLYDGSPFFPDGNVLWKMAESLGVTVFGTSAKYLASCESADITPKNENDLSKLRAILSTGSPLSEESFDYVYREIKKDVMLSSIAGGTDIISCFMLGNPTLPVFRGEIQCSGLGMDIDAFDVNGNSLTNEDGELVCKKAFPSMPIYFWNDPENEKYRHAYFDVYPGVWHHGDYITITKNGGIKMHGRSDATLNPGGVRIGTAEIYRVVEALSEIEDSLVIGQPWENDERVILFVKLSKGSTINTELVDQIRLIIKTQCSPRHVPQKIIPVSDIPYTINGKKVELVIKNILYGKHITNKDALKNPEVLEEYKNITELRY